MPVADPELTEKLLQPLVHLLDLGGTFAFALSGAMAGIRRRLDLFGVLVLAVAAATFGGITRDVLIGDVPPAALVDWRYFAAAVAAGLLAFAVPSLIERLGRPVRVLDAAGLALFAVAGAQKALDFGLSPVMAALLGMVTGVGGGVARDVLLSEIPAVLKADLYAVAALAGAASVVAGYALGAPFVISAAVGGLVCFGLRMVAIQRRWSLPVARERPTPKP